MIEQLIIILVILTLPVVAFIGKGGPVKPTESVEVFTLGYRQFKSFRIAAGISMSFVGGAATLNMASLGYQYGWSVLVDPISVFTALIISAALAPKIRAGNGLTLTDLLSSASPTLKVMLGVITFIVYQLLTAAQFVAVQKLLSPYFPAITPWLVVAFPAVAVFLYTYFRGLNSVTSTDVYQLLIMLALYVIPVLWVFAADKSGVSRDMLPRSPIAPINLLIYLALPLLFVPVSYDTNIRIKAAASLFHAQAGLILGGILYFLLVGISIGVGVYMHAIGKVVESPEKVLPFFFNTKLGDFSLLGTIAVLVAIVSTLDSFAFDTIVSASNDVLGPSRAKGLLSDRRVLALSTLVVLVISFIVAFIFQQILGLILAAMLLYVSTFIPIAIGRLLNVPDRWLVVTSSLTGIAIIIAKAINYTPPLEPLAFLIFHLVLIAVNRIGGRK